MIILDTNIISEMMKKSPSENVMTWIDNQEITSLFVTTITLAEITYGINVLPKGNRRQHIEDAFHKTIHDAFQHRILSFNESAANEYGRIMGNRKKIGKPLSILYGQIAAIALSNKAALATRNTRDFIECKLEIINPFE